MTWTYHQATGALYRDDVNFGNGYSGHGEGKNKHDMQDMHNVGPIPVGNYTIEGPPYDTTTHGPFVLRLVPDPENEMFGRSGFLIHGDSVKAPGTASEGCIILSRDVRERIWQAADRALAVVP
jgi:hypothetical protein